jgi:hypothetical protein
MLSVNFIPLATYSVISAKSQRAHLHTAALLAVFVRSARLGRLRRWAILRNPQPLYSALWFL